MRAHERVEAKERTRILALVLDTLGASERASVQSHLAECEPCREEHARWSSFVGAALSEDALARAPRPRVDDLWNRLASRLRPPGSDPLDPGSDPDGSRPRLQPWRDWAPSHDAFVSVDSPWQPCGVPGVEARRLHVDRERNRVTMVVRMEPGSSYPAHRHAGPEECYVIQGDLRVHADQSLRTGDFQRMEVGTSHPVQSTEDGCLLLISCSLEDEIRD